MSLIYYLIIHFPHNMNSVIINKHVILNLFSIYNLCTSANNIYDNGYHLWFEKLENFQSDKNHNQQYTTHYTLVTKVWLEPIQLKLTTHFRHLVCADAAKTYCCH